jgi:site-specific recombinase XerC
LPIFLGRSADKAATEDVHRYQLWLASIGTTVGTANVAATALRFFFKVTLKRHDLAEEVVSTREPRRLPVVLSQEEVGRLLASAINIKHKAVLSLAYATGLRASEVVSLKLTDIDRDRMVIRVEQGKGKNTTLDEATGSVDEAPGSGSDFYVANQGDNTIVRMKQDGTVIAIRQVMVNGQPLDNISLNGIATSTDATDTTFPSTIFATFVDPNSGQGGVLAMRAF